MSPSKNGVSAIEIVGAKGLDPIIVYFFDVSPRIGHVTITCYGSAWTSYFGAMGSRTISQFVHDADVDYLVNKLTGGPILKGRKKDIQYLEKIVRAVKAVLLVDEREP